MSSALNDQLKEDMKEMLSVTNQNLAQLEACRRVIIRNLQQQQPVVEPFQKLELFEKKIRAELSFKWDVEAVLSEAGVKF